MLKKADDPSFNKKEFEKVLEKLSELEKLHYQKD